MKKHAYSQTMAGSCIQVKPPGVDYKTWKLPKSFDVKEPMYHNYIVLFQVWHKIIPYPWMFFSQK